MDSDSEPEVRYPIFFPVSKRDSLESVRYSLQASHLFQDEPDEDGGLVEQRVENCNLED